MQQKKRTTPFFSLLKLTLLALQTTRYVAMKRAFPRSGNVSVKRCMAILARRPLGYTTTQITIKVQPFSSERKLAVYEFGLALRIC